MSATGNWNVTIKGPMGGQAADLELKEDGGALSGLFKDRKFGMEAPFDVGKIEGDQLLWCVELDKPMKVKVYFRGKLDGDTITGQLKFGAFGAGTFEAKRV